MIRALGLALTLAMSGVLTARADELESSATRITIGANEYLVAGTEAIRAGDFDEGIRLTSIGLERSDLGARDRAAGLGNLCAAYVSKDDPDSALPYCNRSLELNGQNWRVLAARARAYFLKRMYPEAARDNDAAAAINPDSVHVKELRGKLTEQLLRTQVTL